MTTNPESTTSRLAVAVMLLVVALGAGMWIVQPEKAVAWAMSMLFLPTAWGVLMLLRRRGAWRWAHAGGWRDISRAIVLAGLVLAVPLAIGLASSLGALDDDSGDMSRRASGVVIGLVLVVLGNAMPKRVTPLSATRCEPSRKQALQRFSGWAFVLAGAGYAIAWLALPVERADTWGTLIVGATVLLVGARLTWYILVGRRAEPPVQLQ